MHVCMHTHTHTHTHTHVHTGKMTSTEAVRARLEGYARAKLAAVLQPMSEKLLVEQPADPAAFMVRCVK